MKIINVIIFVFFCIQINVNASNNLFPEMEKWKLTIEEQIYTPENLWDLINGAADLYLSYDFENLHTANYINEKNEVIRVEIYKHKNKNNAYGIYSSERMKEYDFFNIGIQGYSGINIINFVSGEYYIKMAATGSNSITEKSLTDFANKIDIHLKQDNTFPKEFEYFPSEDKVEYSDIFINKSYLGYSFFKTAFACDYEINNEKFKLFLMISESNEEAKAKIDRYLNLLKAEIKLNNNYQSVNDPFNGEVLIGTKNQYIFGAFNFNNKTSIEKYLEEFILQIP